MRTRIETAFVVAVILITGSNQTVGQTQETVAELSQWDEAANGPLPRWRQGGRPAVAPNQPLHPYAISRTQLRQAAPSSGLIESPPEYAPVDGVLYRFSSGAWPTLVRDLVVALTADPAHDEIAYVVVANSAEKTAAANLFFSGGADLSKVQFIIVPNDSIWMRDYGPHFIWHGGARVIVDSHYYPARPLDNFIPSMVADDFFKIPSYDIGLYYSGGNFQAGANRNGFVTSLIHADNPGFGASYIDELYDAYQGMDVIHILPQLPASVDGTGHIDMWFYIVDDDTVVISEFLPGSNSTAISITNNAVPYMENLGYEVFRVPDHNGFHPNDPQAHFTYANAFRVNDRIFIPSYGAGGAAHAARDAQALATWQAAAPGVEIVPINSYDIIWAAGAIHCIVKQVPRYTNPVPTAHVISPDGGELLTWDSDVDLQWAATDDLSVTSVDLLCSTDGGTTFPHVIATGETNDGHYEWNVQDLASNDAYVKVVAHDADTNSSDGVSANALSITCLPRTVYDFKTGAGVDKWGWGHQIPNWAALNGVRRPTEVGSEISSLVASAYLKISESDATGTDADANRYIAPIPGGLSSCCSGHATPGCDNATCQNAVCACDPFCCGASGGNWDDLCAGTGANGSGCGAQVLCAALCPGNRYSAHIFEFEIGETPSTIQDISIIWEGYGDAALQMELYVWDDQQGNWGDGSGAVGENRYVDNFAGNRDEELTGQIRSDFDHYINANGILTILLYAERPSQESFHDYVAVTVTSEHNGDVNNDGLSDFTDLDAFVAVLLGIDTDAGRVCRSDLDVSGDADGDDIASMIDALLSP
ncbi:MAG: agmatine deiminase family protein [Phycisphaerales bacterium]|nr:agmatine deiminase family protein [Phycisphaerales bacterium]